MYFFEKSALLKVSFRLGGGRSIQLSYQGFALQSKG